MIITSIIYLQIWANIAESLILQMLIGPMMVCCGLCGMLLWIGIRVLLLYIIVSCAFQICSRKLYYGPWLLFEYCELMSVHLYLKEFAGTFVSSIASKFNDRDIVNAIFYLEWGLSVSLTCFDCPSFDASHTYFPTLITHI